jgi:hypothetical protein
VQLRDAADHYLAVAELAFDFVREVGAWMDMAIPPHRKSRLF